mmetsp:Transcript_349/g.803  ORF Transcript_349/g.803 Transcript_349/m.803 type:complete len:239 (+) Transcript_349:708-1424(+)
MRSFGGGPPDAILGGQVVRAYWAPAAVRVELRRQLPGVDLVKGGREDVPRRLQLIAANEEPLIAIHRIQDQPLVSIWKLEIAVVVLVLEVELGVVEVHAESGDLVADLQGDGLLRLDPNHQLVVSQRPVLVLVQAARDAFELHSDLRVSLVQRLAGLHEKGHPFPPRVVDEERRRRESRHNRPFWDRLVIKVPRISHHGATLPRRAARVLSDHHVLEVEGSHGAQDLDLLVANVLGVE